MYLAVWDPSCRNCLFCPIFTAFVQGCLYCIVLHWIALYWLLLSDKFVRFWKMFVGIVNFGQNCKINATFVKSYEQKNPGMKSCFRWAESLVKWANRQTPSNIWWRKMVKKEASQEIWGDDKVEQIKSMWKHGSAKEGNWSALKINWPWGACDGHRGGGWWVSGRDFANIEHAWRGGLWWLRWR